MFGQLSILDQRALVNGMDAFGRVHETEEPEREDHVLIGVAYLGNDFLNGMVEVFAPCGNFRPGVSAAHNKTALTNC